MMVKRRVKREEWSETGRNSSDLEKMTKSLTDFNLWPGQLHQYQNYSSLFYHLTNDKMAEQQQISADYKSPTSTQSFSSKLPSLPKDHDVKSKTEYLTALRSGIVQMQSDVNTFLTKKMEEEKSLEASKGQGNKSKEEQAEEMYGEEDPEAE